MKVVVFVGGSIVNGFESAASGESRWAQNLGKMLAQRGHVVDIVANDFYNPPSWGHTSPMPNVNLLSVPNSNIFYDIALYVPWEHQFNGLRWKTCRSIPVNAKYYVHCTFSWTHSLPNQDCWKYNHILAYPFKQEDSQFIENQSKNPFPTFFLPYPIFEELVDVKIENRKDIIWTCKDVYHSGWDKNGEHVPRIGTDILRCVKKLSKEFSFNFHLLSTRLFDPSISTMAARYKPLDIVKDIPNVRMHELIPKNELQDIFKSTRLNLIVSGLFGSFGESIAMGCAPLCYSGHIYRAAAEECGIKLDSVSVTKNELFDTIYRLYTDDSFYLKYINACRREMSYYHYNEAYKYFLIMAKELGLEVE
jgi:hypothetical protein